MAPRQPDRTTVPGGARRQPPPVTMPDRATLADRILAFRDRTLARPAFQRWATRIWPVSLHARREAKALFDLTAGFAYSKVLAACVRLGVLDRLAERPMTAGELAAAVGLEPDAAERLLRAGAALRLLSRRRAGRYGLGALGAALLGQPGVRAMIVHHDAMYEDIADPVGLLASGGPGERLGRTWAYATADRPDALAPEAAGDYTAIMAASQAFIAEEVLSAFSFAPFRCLLDVGGGNGTFLSMVARRHPDLSLQLFDLPAVAHHARERLAAEGLSGRVSVTAGSFRHDGLPTGADVVSLIRIVHDHPDDTVRALLSRVRTALPPGGILVVAEPMAGTGGAEAVEAYFVMFLLAMGSGRLRTRDEIARLLADAGFEGVREHRTATPMLVRVLSARRAG